MKTKSFKESDIEFTFGDDWIIKKYDDHAYFKILSGRGLKGVDFIGIYKDESLFLIEVKNYHKRSYSPVAPDLSDIQGSDPILGMDLHGKMEDSLRLIRIVNRYLSTRWWFKIASFFRNALKSKAINKDWHFWTRVGELSEYPQNVYPILWLEIDTALFDFPDYSLADLVVLIKKEYAKGKVLPTKSLQYTSLENNVEEKVLQAVKALRKE